MHFEYPPGATPIDPDEAAGLKLKYISTQGELNAVEQENILKAQTWLAGKKSLDALSDKFLRDLHKRMFGDVWKWAGDYRRSDKNIGVSWHQIPTSLHQLLQDARYWVENGTYGLDEIGARFHHRLVSVHCFANGNGRHARLATDTLLRAHKLEPFSWGSAALGDVSAERVRYIAALRSADLHDYQSLLAFVRS